MEADKDGLGHNSLDFGNGIQQLDGSFTSGVGEEYTHVMHTGIREEQCGRRWDGGVQVS